MQDYLESLKGRQVEVVYQGLVYRGRLIGASDEEIDLETFAERVSLPMEGVTSIRKAG